MSNTIEIREVCDVFDGPHATPKKTATGPIYLGIDAITADCRLNPLEYNYLSEEDYKIWTKRVTPVENDIVFSYEATLGRYAMIPANFYGCLGRRLALIRVKDNRINPTWLYYYFMSPEWKVFIANHTVKGSTVDRISVEAFPSYKIPSIERQKQDDIVKILKSIDDRIENNKRICSELEAMAKSLYDYWFVQFDFPDENGNPYKSFGGKMTWNDKLKTQIPQYWQSGTLSAYGMILSGGTPFTGNLNFYAEEGIAWITPNDLSNNTSNMFISHGERDISLQGLNSSSATLIPPESILLSTRAPIGYIAISMNELTTNQGFKTLVPNNTDNTCFLYYLLKRNIPYLEQMGTGTTFKEVSKDSMEHLLVILPPDNILTQFTQKIKPYMILRKTIEQETKWLISVRDWLLPMLMNGQTIIGD